MKSVIVTLLFLFLASCITNLTGQNNRMTANVILDGEMCQPAPLLMGAGFSKKDLAKETALCDLDFYSPSLRLCPKNWSTSPSTLVLSAAQGTAFTASMCADKKSIDAYDKEAKFKFSINESGTSGTFSPSSVLYYHLSRYFESTVEVPVAVFKTMDKTKHYDMVSSKAANFENDMVRTAWDFIKRAESQNINVLNPASETFTQSGQSIYGALIDSIGNEKYGELIRGLKQPQWGLEQHKQLKQTPAFVALATAESFAKASDAGLKQAQTKFSHEVGQFLPTSHQMMAWMQEMSDMAILDYIIQQQDRPGNIHFQWKIAFVQNGKLETKRLKLEDKYKSFRQFAEVEKLAFETYKEQCHLSPCFVLQKTWLEDNDAGGRQYYNKFYREAGILESFRHLNAKTYLKLQALARDFSSNGPIYNQIRSNYTLDGKQFEMIVRNTIDAASILKNNCKSIFFDLDAEKYMLTGDSSAVAGVCL